MGNWETFPSPGVALSVPLFSVANCSWSSVTTTKISVYSIDYKKWAGVVALSWGSASNIKSRSGSVWCWLELHHAANIFAFFKIVNWDDCTQRIYVRDQCNINAVHSHLCPLKMIAYFWGTSRILLTFPRHYETLSANKHDYFSK